MAYKVKITPTRFGPSTFIRANSSGLFQSRFKHMVTWSKWAGIQSHGHDVTSEGTIKIQSVAKEQSIYISHRKNIIFEVTFNNSLGIERFNRGSFRERENNLALH